MKIGVTGSSGFIGKALCKHLQKKGHELLLMQRSTPTEISANSQFFPFDLTEVKLPNPSEVDAIVHCAVIVQSNKQPNAYSQNVEGTKKLQEFCHAHGKQFVFLSTMSAHSEAISVYGKHKFELENEMNAKNETVLKLGLVIGSTGGLFQNIVSTIQKASFVPMVDGGVQPIQTLFIDDLCTVVASVIKNRQRGKFILGTTQVYQLKDLYVAVATALNKKPKLVSVPYGLLYFILSITESLRIPLPVGKENLMGLKQLKAFETGDDIKKLGAQLKTMEESVKIALNG